MSVFYAARLQHGMYPCPLRSVSKANQTKPRHSSLAPKPSSLRTTILAHVSNQSLYPNGEPEIIPRKANGHYSVSNMFDAYWRFSRVHTLQSTALSITSISLLAVQKRSDLSLLFFLGVLQAIVGAILANLYTVGINQLSDIEIDKVNKPYLPLASGELSIKTGKILTSSYAILCLWLGWSVNSWPLRLALFSWLFVGTAYSVNIPLLRWKKNPAFTAIAFCFGQGTIFPILFHLHVQTFVYGRPAVLSQQLIFVVGFMSLYSAALALFKDIPDVEGDKLGGVQSFAMQIGEKQVFWTCIWLIEMAYGFAILCGLLSSNPWSKSIMVSAHAVLAIILWKKANSVDPKRSEATESFYLYIWKLFYVEYMLLPFLRW